MNRPNRNPALWAAAACASTVSLAANAVPIYDAVNNLTYVRDTTAQTWANANAAAIVAGGNLARVRSAAANEAIRAVSQGGGWIGASDIANEGNWRWTVGDEQFWSGPAANNPTPGFPVGGLYTNWNTGEPNDVGGEDVAEIVGGGGWNDLPTTATRTSVREFAGNQAAQTFNGRTYYLLAPSTWIDANNTAQSLGGQLARIDDAAENAFIASLLSNSGGVSAWIGAADQLTEGNWQWTQGGDQFWTGLAANNVTPGAPVGGLYSNWNGGEPNDSGGEDFAEIQASGGWNDLPGNVTRIAVVEVVPEPTTLGLLAVGSLAFVVRRRRRR